MDTLTHISDYILTQSWQIALLTLVVAIAIFTLRNKTAHVRYLLWLIVLAKCLVPPFLTVPVAVLPQERFVGPAVPLFSDAPFMPATLAETPSPRPTARTPKVPVSPLALPTESQRDLTTKQWLALVWVTGVGLYCLTALIQALRSSIWLHRRRHEVSPKLNSEIIATFSSLAVRLPPRVWLVRGIAQPFVWGLVRGSIYLPAEFAESSRDKHHRDILVHELCHVLRFDVAVNLLQVLAQALFWFHPLIWWANHRIRTEREKCCDEMTIACLGTHAKDYGKAIVNTIVNEYESTRPVPSMAIAGSTKSIEERIKSMLRPGKRFYTRTSRIAAMTVLSLALLTVPTALVLTSRAGAAAIAQQDEKPAVNVQEATSPLHQALDDGDLERVKVLIAQGADINAQNNKGGTPLHTAAYQGYKDVVEILLEQGADVSLLNNKGWNALHFAADEGNWEIAVMLMAKGLKPETGVAQVNPPIAKGTTALHLAAMNGNLGVVKVLLTTGMDVNIRHDNGGTPLLNAVVFRGGRRVIDYLLAVGGDVNIKGNKGKTTLHAAAYGTRKSEIVELLLKHGADVNAKDEEGRIPLHGAPSEFGHETVDNVKLLIGYGSKVDVRDQMGLTPLHMAAGSGSIDIVKVLIANGADVNAQTTDGKKPMDEALQMNSINFERGVGQLEVANLLLKSGTALSTIQLAAYAGDIEKVREFVEKGVDVNGKNALKLAPLHTASLGGHRQVVTFLIANGAVLNAEAHQSKTPLHYAAMGGHADIAEVLVSRGANVHGVEKNKSRPYRHAMTPLQQAAFYAGADVIEVLLDHGANVNVKGGNGRTPLADAMQAGDKRVVELLIFRGADINAGVLFNAASSGRNEIMKLLIAKGANVNAQFERKGRVMAPLHVAANQGRQKIAKTLLTAGANVNIKDERGRTPLYHAMLLPHNETVKVLTAGGADINGGGGWAYLHTAAYRDQREIAKTLLTAGAKVNIKTKEGKTPLALARQYGHTEFAEILLKHGAEE